MQTKAGSFSVGSTGSQVGPNLPFLPTYVEFKLGPNTGSIDTSVTSFSHGWATGSNQSVDSIYIDASRREQQASVSNVIMLRRYDSATSSMVDRVKASFAGFSETSPGSGIYQFTLNFTAADANRQIRYVVHG